MNRKQVIVIRGNKVKTLKGILISIITISAILNFTSVALSKNEQPIVRFSLKSDKQIYETKEEIVISGFVKNLSSRLIYLQTLRAFSTTKLMIKTPNGKELLLVDERGPFVPTDYSAVLQGEKMEYFTLRIRSNNLEEKNTASLWPFIQKGQYEISFAYQDLNPLLKRALTGTFSSDPINISIVSLERIKELTNIKKNTDLPPDKNIIQKKDSTTSVSQQEATILAGKYVKKQKAYRRKGLIYLFTSDTAEAGYWIVAYEEAKSKIFHVIKVDENTGKAEEAYFID